MSSGLSIQNAQVSYGRRQIVYDLSLPTLAHGSLTALIGPNGAGKSTLLRAVAGLEKMQGVVRLGDLDLTKMSVGERARRVTYMPQNLPPGLSLSVMESVIAALRVANVEGIALSSDACMREAFDALQRIGIAHLADQLLSTLSGGQRQLVSLAQLIARRPQVMLLDEPTSALDLNYQLKVMDCVRDLVREHNLIAVVVLHDINLAARYADHIAVLRQGRLYASGAADDVLDTALFAEVYGVRVRIERCSQQTLQVLVDGAVA
ncbi:ABC transporter ATP-binding protein [Pseudomonas sp. G5001]|jgi:iron complex transport system ATP-binding protein|uniref:ABC transporter ATP-binding protein n=1 Tax=unclassified Pseudomonas TaxID=196821 RepID=UPI0015A3646F|nr:MULTISPECIES: ABC transporter ATP-binding protein [unclassified Pseudomonas]NWB10152.1 ABC transporter ATP-binding protein [Pseudomonas sp. D5002]NWB76120.1 ABC transporter ATP-binding protein [Pseudomonas sp. G5001]